MLQKWIGIDVAKDTFEAALTHDGVTRNFPNSSAGAAAFLMWARTLPDFFGHVAMEATGIYSAWLAASLHELGAQPAIVNPGHIHAYGRSFGRRNKTDKIDAKLITRFANERQPRLWQPADLACEGLRSLLEQRESVKQEQDKLTKQLSTMKSPNKIFLQRHKANERFIKKLEAEIAKHERTNSELRTNAKLLRTIPGIGEWTARAILACTNNLKDFTRRSLASYTGLAPCVYHSGTYAGGGHIPHTGHYLIKKYLYMAAQSQTQSRMQNPLASYYQHLRNDSHKTGKQALCALMRKMILIARALVISGKPYCPQLHTGQPVDNPA